MLLRCPNCPTTTLSRAKYVRHALMHRNDVSGSFHCPFRGCTSILNSYNNFISHIRREHPEGLTKGRNGSSTSVKHSLNDRLFKCSVALCHREITGGENFLKHLKGHAKTGHRVNCPFNQCRGKTYGTEGSFRNHLSRLHRNYKPQNFQASVWSSPEQPEQQHFPPEDREEEMEEAEDTGEEAAEEVEVDEQDLFARSLALFYMQLEAKLHVPVSTIQFIVDELAICSEISSQELARRVAKILKEASVAEETVMKVLSEIQSGNQFHKLNEDLFRSDHKRKQYYTDKFSHVSAESCFLGHLNGAKRESCFAHRIPIRDTLSVLLSNKSMTGVEFLPPPKHSYLMRDVTDGYLYRSKKHVCDNEESIDIILYQDSFEVVNPLGSARKKHKVLAMYYTLLNIPAEHRSKIDNLQLALLCKDSYLKEFKVDRVFGTILQELNDLQNDGLMVDGAFKKVNVTCIAGDNLGHHQIGGFVQCFSGKYFCRYCLITRAKFQKEPCKIGTLRTKQNYRKDVKRAKRDKKHSRGVKSDSVFNQLYDFHVTDPALAPCLAHDLFEGTLNEDVFLCLAKLVKERLIKFPVLNGRIKNFPYKGSDRGSAPAIVNENGKKLGGQAMENYCFIRFMPFFLKDIMDMKLEVCDLLRTIHEMVMYIMMPSISEDQIGVMREIIHEYMYLRRRIFPDVRMRPKHHFLMHYPYLFLQLGPLIRTWTMRFESKHSYFKKCARATQNFRNVTKSVAEKHQVLQAYIQSGNMFKTGVEGKNCTPFHANLYSQEVQAALRVHGLQEKMGLEVTAEVIWKGTRYANGMCVITERDFDTVTSVVIISNIVTNGETFYIIGPVYKVETKYGNTVFVLTQGALRTNEMVCVDAAELIDPWPLELYVMASQQWFTAKHKPPAEELV